MEADLELRSELGVALAQALSRSSRADQATAALQLAHWLFRVRSERDEASDIHAACDALTGLLPEGWPSQAQEIASEDGPDTGGAEVASCAGSKAFTASLLALAEPAWLQRLDDAGGRPLLESWMASIAPQDKLFLSIEYAVV